MEKKFRLFPYWLFVGCLFTFFMANPANSDKSNQRPVTLITGPETLDLLEHLGEPLQQAAGIKPGTIHFHVMLDATLNAMALASQNIILNSGLLLAVKDQDELAAVMAHEIAHLSAGHSIQLEASMKNLSIQSMVAFVAGLAAGAISGNGQIAQAAIMGGSAASQTSLLEMIREKEIQADRLAIHYLSKAGFDPHGMVRFMERLTREQQLNNIPSPYLLTHPLSSQRLMESRQNILALSQNPTSMKEGKTQHHDKYLQQKREDTALLGRVQAVLETRTNDDLNAVMSQFRARLHTNPDDFSARYGLAIAERYMGQLQAATTDLETLLTTHAEDSYLLRERGLLRLELGQPAAAEKDFRSALKIRKNQTKTDLLYHLAFSLHEQGKLTDATHILRQLTLEHPFIAEYFYLLGVVEGKQQHLGSSHLALARYFYLNREESMARWHYQESIRQFSDTEPGKNIASDELKTLKKLSAKVTRE